MSIILTLWAALSHIFFKDSQSISSLDVYSYDNNSCVIEIQAFVKRTSGVKIGQFVVCITTLNSMARKQGNTRKQKGKLSLGFCVLSNVLRMILA